MASTSYRLPLEGDDPELLEGEAQLVLEELQNQTFEHGEVIGGEVGVTNYTGDAGPTDARLSITIHLAVDHTSPEPGSGTREENLQYAARKRFEDLGRERLPFQSFTP